MTVTVLHPIERASRDELAALQLERLRWSLAHAYSGNPRYKAKFDAAGVHPDDLRSLAHLAHFPFTTKADLRAIEAFFAQYRCVAEDDLMAAAVASAGGAMLKLGHAGPVALAIADPFTTEIVKARLQELTKKK